MTLTHPRMIEYTDPRSAMFSKAFTDVTAALRIECILMLLYAAVNRFVNSYIATAIAVFILWRKVD
jgi:hypothetical protein